MTLFYCQTYLYIRELQLLLAFSDTRLQIHLLKYLLNNLNNLNKLFVK